MERKVIAEILLKYDLGISSEKENELIEAWFDKQKEEDWPLYTEEYRVRKQEILSTVHDLNELKPVTGRRGIKRFVTWMAAAAALLAVAFLFWLNWSPLQKTGNLLAIDQFKPGGSTAILKLDDGTSYPLDSEKKGVKVVGGRAVYLDGTPVGENDLRAQDLTVEVPSGGKYQVNLPDGSTVWLNAASTLRYPLQFGTVHREVVLTGEAYFEVHKDPHTPFIVHSRDQQVKVLGTSFNINSYPDRQFVETTLIKGSVKVNDKRLSPGQQSRISSSTIVIVPANMEAVNAWRKGYFLFDNESLVNILASISRWYNVSFDYDDETLKQLIFWGYIDKNQPLSKTLSFLETTQQIQFVYNQGRITVRKNKKPTP